MPREPFRRPDPHPQSDLPRVRHKILGVKEPFNVGVVAFTPGTGYLASHPIVAEVARKHPDLFYVVIDPD